MQTVDTLAWNFQFTTSQGGRQNLTLRKAVHRIFQFTTSQGGRPRAVTISWKLRAFNSRPHKEVDLRRRVKRVQYLVFQFTTSQGGRR